MEALNLSAPRPKILVVDDKEKNLFALSTLLKNLDVDVDLVDSGKSAISRVLRNNYAIILMDVQMPDLDGFDTAKIIRSNSESANVPIIFITAYYNQAESAHKGYESGGVEYMAKPLDAKVLISKIKIFLELHEEKSQVKELNHKLKLSNENLTQFASIASHDLKEPLRGIMITANGLKEDLSDKLCEEDINKLDRIITLSDKAKNLISTLLNYSQVTRIDDSISEMELYDLAYDIADSVKLSMPDKRISIEIEKNLPFIVGHRTKLGEVFRNLITNAVKYNSNPISEINIGLRKDNRGANYIYVQDNGIGIKPEFHESVFGIFKRLHPDNKYGEGSGAGLSIVKQIIEMHKGKIWIESEEGKGSDFCFTLAGL